jgi:hypothetical protein
MLEMFFPSITENNDSGLLHVLTHAPGLPGCLAVNSDALSDGVWIECAHPPKISWTIGQEKEVHKKKVEIVKFGNSD